MGLFVKTSSRENDQKTAKISGIFMLMSAILIAVYFIGVFWLDQETFEYNICCVSRKAKNDLKLPTLPNFKVK